MQLRHLVNENVHNGWIRQSTNITQLIRFVANNFAQNAAHDFPRPRHGQGGSDADQVGRRKATNVLTDQLVQFFNQQVRLFGTFHEHDKSGNGLTLDGVGLSDGRSLRDQSMRHQGTFDFGRTNPVTGNIQNIVDPTNDKGVPVGILVGRVSGKVIARIGLEVRVLEAIVISQTSSCHTGPGMFERQGP